MDRRSFLIGSIGLAGAAALAACTSDSDGSRKGSGSDTGGGAGKAPTDPDTALAAPGTPGLVDEEAFQARVEEYLKGATSSLDPSGPVSIGAFLIAAHRSKDFTWEPTSVTTETLQPVWDHIDEWRDTRDFELMYLHWVLGLADGEIDERQPRGRLHAGADLREPLAPALVQARSPALEGGLEALRERAKVLGVGSLEPREGVGDAFADGLLDDVVEDAHDRGKCRRDFGLFVGEIGRAHV